MNPTRPQRSSKRPLWVGALLVVMVFGLAWMASRHIHSGPASPSQATASGTSANAAKLEQPAPTAAVANAPGGHSARLGAHKVLSYGPGEGQPGMSHAPGQPPVGPESFAVSQNGAILVADVVNQRVLIYSTNGTSLRSLSVPGIALGDVMTDAQGRLYVYDQVRRSLHQYSADGTLQSELSLNPKDIDTRGYFHVANNSVYFADAAARDVLVATLQDGQLAAPDAPTARITEGVHGDSGRVYSVAIDREQALRVQVQDPTAQAAARSLEVPVPGIVSARYAGEDQARQFYIQTERLAPNAGKDAGAPGGNTIILEVFAFSASGQPLGATRLPQNDYAIWTAKLVDIAADGTIVQFLPQREQAQLNCFTP
jgi:hypothetical protein